MFKLVLQKMIHNSWMVLCLAAGSLLAVALISSIPMYTDAIMQRMLIRDLEQFQRTKNVYSGMISARYNFYNPTVEPGRAKFYDYVNTTIKEDLIPKLGLPVKESTKYLTLDYLLGVDPRRENEQNRRANMQIQGMQGFKDHVIITHGEMAKDEPVDGVYEGVVSEEALINLDLVLGQVYDILNMMSEEEIFKIKITGIYTQKSTQDLFWFEGTRPFSESIIVDFDLFERDFVYQYAPNLTFVNWYNGLDYQQIKVENLNSFLQVIERYQRLTHEYRIDFHIPVLPIFEEYSKRANTLSLMLLFLQTPVLLMLVFFIYMVSQLVINNERNEIAVLKSRGAGTQQVFNIYLTESLILGSFALIVGPLTGFFVTSVLGSSNGFMEFVQRVALPVRLNFRAYLYAIGGFALFVITMMLPVVVFSRTTIVEHKRNKVRTTKKPFWKRFFLDIALIGISLYGLYSYYSQQQILLITGVEGSSLPVDPLLFGISVLFILGTGLLLLRIFPYLVNMLFSLGKKVWTPQAYAAFIQVARSGGIQQFLMIFLILSLSIGVFNSTAARTINRNVEDKITYSIGADITLRPYWEDLSGGSGTGGALFTVPSSTSSSSSSAPQFLEPEFKPYTELEGVELATKVFRKTKVTVKLPGGAATPAELMAVIPNEFAKVSSLRRDLLPHHWYNYLNLLAASPRAVLVSTSLRDQYELKQGDSILLTWAGQSSIEGIVYAFIDYWPGINPRLATNSEFGHRFVVANLNFVHAKMAIEPYEIWIDKKKSVASKVIFDDIQEREIRISKMSDANQEIIKQKNDPLLQGTNGVLTLGFLVSMAISLAGFVIYWVLSLRSRVLQFGIIRAMGMSKGKVSWMLVWEHLLISGLAILMGILIGRVSAGLFVPLIQLVYASSEQVPPFRIVIQPQDLLQIYIMGLAMIVIGIALFRVIISRLNVHQALKLGEE